MMSLIEPPIPASLQRGPAWEVARLFPDQGDWDEADYLALNRMTNRLVELVDGRVEVLELPTKSHQRRVLFLRDLLKSLGVGDVLVSPYPVRVAPRKFREPDVVFAKDPARFGEDFGEGVDLVMEVVSQDRDRDFVKKRDDYAAAGIAEYWIIDPEGPRILVLSLQGGRYEVVGEHGPGQVAQSRVLEGFEVAVDRLFAQT
jgi:Uma2 family endonuclease